MDGQERIAFTSSGRLKVLPDGPGGTEVVFSGGQRWVAYVRDAVPARLKWRVQLGSALAQDLDAIRSARKQWKLRKIETHGVERGSLFGFFGKVLDTRRLSITRDVEYATRAEAEVEATKIAMEFGLETSVFPAMKEPAHGTVVLSNGDVTIRAKDVIWVTPAMADDDIEVHDVEYGRGFRWHNREDRKYRGHLYITVDSKGKLAIASMASSETLLQGLVPAEIFPSAPLNALKAQAVSARGELLVKIGHRHLADPYLVCSDVHCQVYKGISKENSRTTRAVLDTRGEMLFSADRLVDTVYCANCGGHTEHNENVWRTPASLSLRGRPDGRSQMKTLSDAAVRAWVSTRPSSFCAGTKFGGKNYRWTQTVQVQSVRDTLNSRGVNVGQVKGLVVNSRGVSGRALRITIKGTDRDYSLDGELNIRKLLGGLKSSMFVFDSVLDNDSQLSSWRFTGGGFGHGVGMCQSGAIGMAQQDHDYAEILKFYYHGAKVQRIY